jgi:hypothetical protein
MEPVGPAQLRTAARIADALVYAVGLAGVVAGALLLRRGDIGFAIVAWCLTFVAGAGLRLAAWLTRGVAELLDRQTRIEEGVTDLRTDRVARDREAAPVDPYGRWGSGRH